MTREMVVGTGSRTSGATGGGAATSNSSSLFDRAEWQGALFIDGEWLGAAATAPVTSPATGETLATAGVASADEVARACAGAATAQATWAATAPTERAAIVRRAIAVFERHAEELTAWLIREAGATRLKAASEVASCGRVAQLSAELASAPRGELLQTTVPGRTSLGRRVPLGVVGVIAPWNAPLVIALRSVAPALVLGNAVVLKPDQRTAVCGGVALARVFEEAGLPAGLLQVVPGEAEAGAALVADPHVAMVSFTGSTPVGRIVGRVAGEQLKRTVLELGGNNALVVLADADLERASSAGAWSSFLHQGQICQCAGRHIVHRSIAEPYAEALAERAARLVTGDPWQRPDAQIGPLVDARQLANVRRIVADSVAAGARVLAGGEADGLVHAPTVLADVTATMPAFAEEIFGPVAPVIAFDTDEEAVELANAGGFGLVASVLSADPARARAIADRIHAGVVHVNDHTINSEFSAPFGGVGASGNGYAVGGPATLDAFTEWRWETHHDTIRPTPF